jgi:putative tryptophan/tyrosine transport system substrate-binding protein
VKRRHLLLALASFAFVPLRANAQPAGRKWRIGVLSGSSSTRVAPNLQALLQGLRNLGYVEGRDFVIEPRFAEGSYDRLQGLAAELVQLKVDVITAGGAPAVKAAQQATHTIPIVMTTISDPVGLGLVASLSRPGGNMTGRSNLAVDLSEKYLELLHAAVPKVLRVAVLVNPGHVMHPDFLKRLQVVAKSRGIAISSVTAKTRSDIETAFAVMARDQAGALIVLPDTLFAMQERQIAELALKYRLPAIAGDPAFSQAGGLISYGQNSAASYTAAAAYIDKILKGAKPGDLPVEQSSKLDLVINGKTARVLGVTIPQELLLRADKVIE